VRFFVTLVLLAASLAAQAQAYPNRPIRVIVPFVAGGPPDILARLLGQKMGESLGQPLVIDNRPGAGGNVGYAAAAKAPADGYTVLLGSINTHAINPTLYGSVPFDPEKDFAPVSQIALVHNVLVVHPSSPYANVKDLLAAAAKEKLTFGSAGNGTTLHLAGELMKIMARVDLEHVPYKGAPQALTDLVAGRIAMAFSGVPPAIAHIQAGRLKPLAVTAPRRIAQLPQVPTVAESGLPGYEVVAWNGFLVPAGTAPETISRLHAETVKALAAPEVREKLIASGFEPVGGTSAEFAAVIERDIAKWSRVVKKSGAKVD
jgi:tripartite-type tricarboxylate transporter receptor subunit TctC